ncbi:hypothetical protein L1049_019257 [Liquidambar formosana]|uniref:KIB1-4 beta-propeller domain-containing protein n=1 Tax=Liquidambar formosana TaxID=63359 RepID=A0AAP0S668_LIQFO
MPCVFQSCSHVSGSVFVLSFSSWYNVETINLRSVDEPFFQQYLVETPDGELLKVCRHMEWDDDSDDDEDTHYHTLQFVVLKLDEKNKRWIRVKSLGDKALFLGYNRAICLSALECPEFKANCIYFTDDFFEGYHEHPLGCYDAGVFNLKDGIIKRFYQNPTFWAEPCIWITPTAR